MQESVPVKSEQKITTLEIEMRTSILCFPHHSTSWFLVLYTLCSYNTHLEFCFSAKSHAAQTLQIDPVVKNASCGTFYSENL